MKIPLISMEETAHVKSVWALLGMGREELHPSYSIPRNQDDVEHCVPLLHAYFWISLEILTFQGAVFSSNRDQEKLCHLIGGCVSVYSLTQLYWYQGKLGSLSSPLQKRNIDWLTDWLAPQKLWVSCHWLLASGFRFGFQWLLAK